MIDFKILNKSIKHYSNRGFRRVETPWTVTDKVSDITKPLGAKSFELVHEDGKILVASAEQGFLYQTIKGFLPSGRFQSITPCFRKDSFDIFHTKYFMKNELFLTDNISDEGLNYVIKTAVDFFSKFFHVDDLDVSETDEPTSIKSFDINVVIRNEDGKDDVIELGSYGIREHKYIQWIYGTACAEPRLSNTIKYYGISHDRNNKR